MEIEKIIKIEKVFSELDVRISTKSFLIFIAEYDKTCVYSKESMVYNLVNSLIVSSIDISISDINVFLDKFSLIFDVDLSKT